ncbi:hypothetical protein GCM10009836_46040 [Pseudonocardia ailaonensis]|uniref:DUF998 domain-containing protein n=1 Tax=Pseudonocardia ailaonensis TaxID=367279 RepID=A0ABN2NAN9_9PSEU
MLTRLAPAVGLFLLAPLVAEFLLGNLPVTALFALVALAPLYGGGALLVREVARRSGRGWPTMLLLGLAYGVIEEGITTQSLFNPHYLGTDLLSSGFVPALGIAVPWTVGVLTLHTVWSIATPIALVESVSRRRGPWLGTPGLVVTAVLFLAGGVATTAQQLSSDPFRAPAPQLVGTVVVAVLLVVAAFLVPRPRTGSTAGTAPSPWILLGLTLAAGVVWELVPMTWWAVVAWALLLVAALLTLPRWSKAPNWTQRHVLALAAGTTLTYAWHAFGETPVFPSSPTADLVGNALFAAGAVALLVVAWVRVSRAAGAADRSATPVRANA